MGKETKMRKAFWVLITLLSIYPCLAQEYFIIGDKPGDAEVLSPRQIEEGPDGNIYIFDRQSAFIKVFSADGRFLRKMGGKGEGPGETKRTDGMSFNFTFDKKMLYFTEFFEGHRWITFMELSGKCHGVLKLKMEKNYGILRSIQLKEGDFLAQVSFLHNAERQGDYFLYRCPIALVKINPAGEIATEILRTEQVERISSMKNGADVPIPFGPSFCWTLLKDNSIVFSEGLSNVFKIYDGSGKITGEIKTPLPEPQPVTPEDLEKWKINFIENFRDKDWFNRFGKVINKYKKSIHEKKPNLNGISATPGGNLLAVGRWDSQKNTQSYRLMDLKGAVIKNMEINGYGLKISEHFVFCIAGDEDENTLVLCLKRKGNEAEDLARLEKALAER